MQIRRALLLIGIVLGLAAVAAALSPPPDGEEENGDSPPELREPEPPPGPARVDPVLDVELRIRTEQREGRGPTRPRRRSVPAGSRVALVVWTDAPGEVTIPRLGQLRFAEERAPARFDLFLEEVGTYEVRFEPNDGGRALKAGEIRVTEPE